MLRIVGPQRPSSALERMIISAADACNKVEVSSFCDDCNLEIGDKLLVAFDTDEFGLPNDVYSWMRKMREKGKIDCLAGVQGAVLAASSCEFYTKTAAGSVIFNLNRYGVEFIGHSLVEALPDFQNFRTWQKSMNISLDKICMTLTAKLAQRLDAFAGFKRAAAKAQILVLHASSHKTSNTLSLWHMTAEALNEDQIDIREIQVDNGSVEDCIGCTFKTCQHYGQQKSCYYGGIMISEIFPAIEKADAVVWVCPNYNDALAANLTAVINRLTALYRYCNFYEKCIYAVIVSGNSGNDAVARQLLGALNINKGFRLPPKFAVTATANDPGSIMNIPGIADTAADFAHRISNFLLN